MGARQDRLAEGLLQALVDNGLRALAEPTNHQVRANLMWAASLALQRPHGRGHPRTGPPTPSVTSLPPARAGLPRAWLWCCPPAAGAIGPEAGEAGPVRRAGVWHSSREDKALRIEEAIIRTEQFFQQMGWVPGLPTTG